jgi:hypothetical protein
VGAIDSISNTKVLHELPTVEGSAREAARPACTKETGNNEDTGE